MSHSHRYRLQAVDERGLGVAACFDWQQDRFGHTIALVRKGQLTPVWQAELTPEESAPILQELHLQADTAGQEILFGHGASQGGQWSLSLCQAGPQTLEFDIAVRIQQPPVERASGYRLVKDSCPAAIQFTPALPQVELRATEQQVRISHVGAAERSLPTTLHWKYRVAYIAPT